MRRACRPPLWGCLGGRAPDGALSTGPAVDVDLCIQGTGGLCRAGPGHHTAAGRAGLGPCGRRHLKHCLLSTPRDGCFLGLDPGVGQRLVSFGLKPGTACQGPSATLPPEVPRPHRVSPHPPPNPLVFSSSSRMIVGVIPSSFPTFLISWICSWKNNTKIHEDGLTEGEAEVPGQGRCLRGRRGGGPGTGGLGALGFEHD